MKDIRVSNHCFKRFERLRPKGKQQSKFLEYILRHAESNGTIDDVLKRLGWEEKK